MTYPVIDDIDTSYKKSDGFYRVDLKLSLHIF